MELKKQATRKYQSTRKGTAHQGRKLLENNPSTLPTNTETEIKNERRDITTNFVEIKRSIREYYKNCIPMNQITRQNEVSEIYKLLTLNHKETENLN